MSRQLTFKKHLSMNFAGVGKYIFMSEGDQNRISLILIRLNIRKAHNEK